MHESIVCSHSQRIPRQDWKCISHMREWIGQTAHGGKSRAIVPMHAHCALSLGLCICTRAMLDKGMHCLSFTQSQRISRAILPTFSAYVLGNVLHLMVCIVLVKCLCLGIADPARRNALSAKAKGWSRACGHLAKSTVNAFPRVGLLAQKFLKNPNSHTASLHHCKDGILSP